MDLEKMAIVASIYDEWNAGNLEYVCAWLSPDARAHRAQAESLASMKRTLMLLKIAVPDLELVQAAGDVCGNQVSDIIAGTGTVTGEVWGCAPSGEPFFFAASCVWQIEHGQIVQVEHESLDQVLMDLLDASVPIASANDDVLWSRILTQEGRR